MSYRAVCHNAGFGHYSLPSAEQILTHKMVLLFIFHSKI